MFFLGVVFVVDLFKVLVKEVFKDLILKGDVKCIGCYDEVDDIKLMMLDLKLLVFVIGKIKYGIVVDGCILICIDCYGESEKYVNYKGSDKLFKVDCMFGKNFKILFEECNVVCLNCYQGGKYMNWQFSVYV